jgi:membrane dipeptidase
MIIQRRRLYMPKKKVRLFLLVSMMALSAAILLSPRTYQTFAQTVTPASRILPFSYYKLDDDLNDSRGVHTATATGTTSANPGKVGKARSLNGSSDYLSLGNMTEFDNAQRFTVAAWVQFSSTAQQAFVTKWGSQVSQNTFWTDFQSGKPRAAFAIGEFIVAMGSGIDGSAWHHVVWAYDGTASTNATRLMLYVDGTQRTLDFSTYTVPSRLSQTTTPVNIGSYNNGTGFFFNGKIDEVGLWSTALSKEMIDFLYKGGTGATYSDLSAADTLHRESLILLAHTHDFSPSDLVKARAAGVTAMTAKLTVDGIDWDRVQRSRFTVTSNWRTRFLYYLKQVQGTADLNGDVVIVRTVQDILDAKNNGKIGVILGSEGANALRGDGVLDLNASGFPQTPAPSSVDMQARMEEYYNLGWRETQLTWAQRNDFWNSDVTALSSLGEDLVHKANGLGILLDVSHLSHAAVVDVISESADPVIISHETPSASGGFASNSTLQAIAASGGGHGVIALHFYSSYYNGALDRARLLDAIDQLKNMSGVGVDHIALGGDYFPEETAPNGWVLPVDELSDITVGLLNRGYTSAEIEKVLGLNLVDLYGRVW